MMRLLRRLAFWLRRDDDLADEIEFHRQMKAEALRAGGMAEADIAAATARAMGNDLLSRERSRDVWIPAWCQDITQDLKFGARMLVKDPRFTAAAVIALGLGIGVNNSVFTIINAALFRPLPFEKPHQLVDPILVDAQGRRGPVSYADYRDWATSATVFESLSAYQGGTANLSEDGMAAERLRAVFVTANTFGMLRKQPFLGRDFTTDDDRPGAPSVAILSYEIWQGRYGGEPDVVGRAVRINSQPVTIIGVMPRQFAYPATAQLWQPMSASPNVNLTDRGARSLSVIGRLRDGVTLSMARAEMEGLVARIAIDHPATNKDLKVIVPTLQEALGGGGQAFRILATLMGAVTFVLLIACANVASLLLARSTGRAREIAVRAALGAGRWRLIRQMLVECLLIAVAASVVGLMLSRYLAGLMATAFDIYEVGAPGSTTRPYWVDISVDGLTVVFLGMLALFVSVAVGVMPSWHLSKTSVNDVLKEGGRAGGATRRARRLTGALLVGQLALTVILLSGAGLLARNFFTQYFTDLVIDHEGIVTMRLVLPPAKYGAQDRQRQFVRELDARLSGLPLFSSVALGSDIPLQPLGFGSRWLAVDGVTWDTGTEPQSVFYVAVGPRYFETLGLEVLQGRSLTALDARSGQAGVVVNQRLASKYFSGGDAIGKRIQLTVPFDNKQSGWFTIVGISPSLPNFLPDRAAEPVAYVPFDADPGSQRGISIIVKTSPSAGKAAAAAALREQVSAMDPDLPVFGIQTFDEAVAMATRSTRTIGSWFAVIALVALVLATVGLYALTAHGVAQRSHEIGVRMALGARSSQVMWLFVRRTVMQLAIGLILGGAGALAIGRLIASLSRDSAPGDLFTIVIVSVILVVVALAASVWPARRAARVDPVVALRAD